MTTEKLVRLKKSIKHHAPELLVATSVITAAIAIVYISKKDDDLLLVLPTAAIEKMRETGVGYGYETDYGLFSVRLIPES